MLIHRFDSNIPMPVYGTAGAAGFDLHLSRIEKPLARHLPQTDIDHGGFSFDEVGDGWVIGSRSLVHARSGIGVRIPPGHYIEIRGRSGWTGCALVVLPGVIDEDYLGEIGAHVVNLGPRGIHVKRGMKICQAILTRCERATFEEDEQLWATLATDRGTNGFGSTGA